MNFRISYMMLGDIRLFEVAFFLVGLLIHFADYKYFKDQKGYHREAVFSHVVSRLFIYGSIVVFVGLQILNWFVG